MRRLLTLTASSFLLSLSAVCLGLSAPAQAQDLKIYLVARRLPRLPYLLSQPYLPPRRRLANLRLLSKIRLPLLGQLRLLERHKARQQPLKERPQLRKERPALAKERSPPHRLNRLPAHKPSLLLRRVRLLLPCQSRLPQWKRSPLR